MSEFLGFFEDGKVDETPTIGGFYGVNDANSFDAVFESATENFKSNWKMDWQDAFIKADVLKKDPMVASFKGDLLAGLQSGVEDTVHRFEEAAGNEGLDAGSVRGWYDKVSALYDNKITQLIEESASVGTLMPIKTIDFPLLVKANVQMSFGDIVKEEITPQLQVKKRIEKIVAYDKKDPTKTWDVPQCFYDGTFADMMAAGNGVELNNETGMDLPIVGKCLVTELTDIPTMTNERIVHDIVINKVELRNGDVVALKTPMFVDMSTNSWIGGVLKQKYINDSQEEKEINDVVSGVIDWVTNTVTISNANTSGDDGVAKVFFKGKLSNEGNERTIRTRYVQEERNWMIGEKTKVDASYTLEELQEHKAFLNMDLYKKSYNDLVMLLSQMEDSDGYRWLDEEFKQYDGVHFDALGWDPFVIKTKFDCDSSIRTVALPSEYIAKELKFKIDRFLIDIADTVKLDNMHFVLWGNPRYISLLNPYVKWVFRNGDSVGGVKLDYSYGVMTSGDVKVYVVSAKKVDALTHQTLRILPFVESNETITFKRYKFGTNVVTSKESAYKDTERMGGSMTYVWGTSRYENVSMQAIQAEVGFENADFITLMNGKSEYIPVGP